MEKLKQHKNVLIPLVLFLLALSIRLYKIDGYLTFLGDEGRDALVVYNILHGKFTLLGPTSSVGGFFLGPIYYYFMAPFLWLFGYNPVGPAVMIALLGSITVVLIHKIGTEFFNKTTGFWAALLYATSPLVVMYSRSSWNPNGMPIFTLLTLYSLYKGITKNNRKLIVLTGMLFGVVMQLHYLGVFVGAIIILYVVLARIFSLQKAFSHKVRSILRDGIYIFVGFLIGFSPFLLFEVRHGFLNLKNIYQFIVHSKEVSAEAGNYFVIVYDVFVRVFGRLIVNLPLPQDFAKFSPQLLTVWHLLSLTVGIICVAFLILQLRAFAKARKEQFAQRLLLLVWLMVGIGLFGFYKKPIYDYYFAFLFPVPFLLVGSVLSSAMSKGLWSKVIAVGIGIGLLVVGIKFLPIVAPNYQAKQAETIAKFVLDKTGGKPYNFALITGGNSDHAYRYFLTVWGKPPVTIENAEIDPQRKTVTDQLLVICESLPCEPLGHSLWEVAGFGRAEIAGEWDVSVVKVYRLIHYTGPQ